MSKFTLSKSSFEGRKMWFFFSAAAALISAVVVFGILQGVTSTSTYYVLKSDVPARTLITSDMMEPQVTNSNPPSSLPYSTVLEGTVYSKFALKAGDLLTESNAGPLSNLSADLPKDFVLASFKAIPSNAVGGKVSIGDYVDLIVITQDGGSNVAKYFLQKVLIMDATIDLDGGTTSSAADTTTTTGGDNSAYRTGIPTLFTVGVSQENAAKIAVANKYEIYMVKSSANTIANGATPIATIVTSTDLLGGSAFDASKSLNDALLAPTVPTVPSTGSATSTPSPSASSSSSPSSKG